MEKSRQFTLAKRDAMKNKKIVILFEIICILLLIYGCGTETDTYISKLGNYKNLTYETKEINITEEDIENEIRGELLPYIEYETIYDDVKIDDIVIFKIEIKKSGEEKFSLISDNYGYWIEGTDNEFDKNLIGKKPGDIITQMPDSMAQDLECDNSDSCKITVLYVRREIPIVLSDEFVQQQFQISSVGKYKQKVKENIYSMEEKWNEEEYKNELLKQVVESSEFVEIDKLIDDYFMEIMDSYNNYADLYEMSIEDVYKYYDVTEQELKETAVESVKNYLVSKEICRKESIELHGAKYNQAEKEYVKDFGYDSVSQFKDDAGEEYLKQEVTIYLAKQFIFKQSTAVFKDSLPP